MSIELFVFLAVSLFMIHEFEEIIFVKNWLVNGQNNPRLAGDMWLKNAAAYPSTAAIALINDCRFHNCKRSFIGQFAIITPFCSKIK
jgi:hypothetical protein